MRAEVEMSKEGEGHSRRRVLTYTIVMSIVGLLPLILALIGLWNFWQRGYVLSRSGERIDDAWAWLYGFYILVGLGVMAYTARYYRRHSDPAD